MKLKELTRPLFILGLGLFLLGFISLGFDPLKYTWIPAILTFMGACIIILSGVVGILGVVKT